MQRHEGSTFLYSPHLGLALALTVDDLLGGSRAGGRSCGSSSRRSGVGLRGNDTHGPAGHDHAAGRDRFRLIHLLVLVGDPGNVRDGTHRAHADGGRDLVLLRNGSQEVGGGGASCSGEGDDDAIAGAGLLGLELGLSALDGHLPGLLEDSLNGGIAEIDAGLSELLHQLVIQGLELLGGQSVLVGLLAEQIKHDDSS